nr:Chain A, Serine acetyltransferase [Salmonella enterica subsp. enterica serovar Typhimurium str. UK-1]4NU8_A Chain A, Peptide from Serine acetyltransferase [Salmonella enterica subsp. enterica serovar Typhi]4ORE_A Chain A, Peptide inhibitor [synthetic construct]
TFEYGDGI